jgi:hypothetical protein
MLYFFELCVLSLKDFVELPRPLTACGEEVILKYDKTFIVQGDIRLEIEESLGDGSTLMSPTPSTIEDSRYEHGHEERSPRCNLQHRLSYSWVYQQRLLYP